jgi:hypothetical protein
MLSTPFSVSFSPSTLFVGPGEAVLLATAAVSFLLMVLAARRLGEPEPVSLFASSLLLSPILAVFWLLIILGAAKDLLFGVRLKWKGEGLS